MKNVHSMECGMGEQKLGLCVLLEESGLKGPPLSYLQFIALDTLLLVHCQLPIVIV